MQKLSNVLNEINKESFDKNAYITKLRGEYPNSTGNSLKAILLDVWNGVIAKGSLKYNKVWQKLFQSLDATIKRMYNNESTMESTLTQFRKQLRDSKFDSEIYKQSIYQMGLTQDRSKERKIEYQEKVKIRNSNRKDLPPIYVEQVLDVMKSLINSNNPYELALAVALSTGSRSIEIFKVSQYNLVKGNPMAILIKGLAKDNGNNPSAISLTRNLVGLKSDQVLSAVIKIRSNLKLDDRSNTNISDTTNRQLNKIFKKIFHPIIVQNVGADFDKEQLKTYLKSFSFHKARYMQGNISYLIYGEPENIPYESYLQDQYGHLSGESTKSYLGINILFRNKEGNLEKDDLKKDDLKKDDLKKDDLEKDDFKKEIDLQIFKNSFSRSEKSDNKISNVVKALETLKKHKIKKSQSELRAALGYSACVMTEGYKQARLKGII